MRPVVVVVLDGLGDRAYAALGGRTASEAAHTPALDALARRSACGLLHPLGRGRAPSSEVAHWALLGGQPDEFPGRAVLEALGAGQAVEPTDVLAHAALRPAERRAGALWVTGRAGPDDAADAAELLGAVDGLEREGLAFGLSPLGAGEAILRVRGDGAVAEVTDSDPFFRDRLPVLLPQAAAPGARRTAAAAAAWSREVVGRLAEHPVNRERARRGRPALSVVTLKWWGGWRPCPSFAERHGLAGGVVVGGSRLHAGLARVLELGFVHVAEGPDPGAALAGRLVEAARALDGGADFALCHVKALDEAGHTKDPRRRQAVVEAFDAVLGPLSVSPLSEAVVVVTGDHATPAEPELIHSGDPVPLLLAAPTVRADRVRAFGERPFAAGSLGHLAGADLMPLALNAANRPLFLGSRPTPADRPSGFPSDVVALDC